MSQNKWWIINNRYATSKNTIESVFIQRNLLKKKKKVTHYFLRQSAYIRICARVTCSDTWRTHIYIIYLCMYSIYIHIHIYVYKSICYSRTVVFLINENSDVHMYITYRHTHILYICFYIWYIYIYIIPSA